MKETADAASEAQCHRRRSSAVEAEQPDEPGSSGDDDRDDQQQPLWWTFEECLPIELLLKIFSYFSQDELCRNIAPVCHRWRRYAYDPVLWQRVRLTLEAETFCHDDALRMLFARTTMLKRLTVVIRHGGRLTLDCLSSVFSRDPALLTGLKLIFLESIDSELCLKSIVQRFSSLESLNISGCVLNEDSIEAIGQLSNVKALDISHCTQITDDGIIALVKGIKCLCSLNIDGITLITDRAVECVVSMHSRTLEHLFLDGEDLTDLTYISQCSGLRTLSISFAVKLNDSLLSNIMTLSNIEVLRIRKGDCLTASALKNLFENGEMKKLLQLNLAECTCVDDEVVKSICLRYGRYLHTLDLSWCSEVTDVGLEAVVSSCRALYELNFTGVNLIVGNSFRNIPDTMPFLRMIDITMCRLIDDNILTEVVSRMPNISILDYYGELIQVGASHIIGIRVHV